MVDSRRCFLLGWGTALSEDGAASGLVVARPEESVAEVPEVPEVPLSMLPDVASPVPVVPDRLLLLP